MSENLPAKAIPDQLPEWMPQTATGQKELSSYQQLNFVKVLQKAANSSEIKQLIEDYGIGATILMPDQVCIADRGEPFRVIPIFFYVEHQKRADAKDSSQFIIERTLDSNSDLARKCQDRNRQPEPYTDGSGRFYTYCTSLQFLCLINDRHLAVIPFAKGGHRFGDQLKTYLLKRIEKSKMPMYGCAVELKVGTLTNRQGQDWEQIDFDTPKGDAAYARKDQMEELTAIYNEAAEAHRLMTINTADEADGNR